MKQSHLISSRRTPRFQSRGYLKARARIKQKSFQVLFSICSSFQETMKSIRFRV